MYDVRKLGEDSIRANQNRSKGESCIKLGCEKLLLLFFIFSPLFLFGNSDNKRTCFQVFSDKNYNEKSLRDHLRLIQEREEFETKEKSNSIKQSIVEIKRMLPKDSKTQKVLVDSLEFFKSEKHTDIRNEIYSFFKGIAENITTQVSRKLARKISSYTLPKKEQERKKIVEELEPSRPPI